MLATLSPAESIDATASAAEASRPRPLVFTAVPQPVSCTSVATLVLWTSCAAIGIAGSLLPYARPVAPKAEPAPVKAEMLQVQLTSEPVLEPQSQTISDPFAPPPAAALANVAPAPAPIAVAEPGPAVAFAVPVEGNVRVVDLAQAAYRGRTSAEGVPGAGLPRPETLVFGQGEGRQPAPSYPPRAARGGQEGVVTVRFTVDPAGKVTAAEAVESCVWPMLNEAAVRTVRERWRFRAGAIRVYEVAIRFRLKK